MHGQQPFLVKPSRYWELVRATLDDVYQKNASALIQDSLNLEHEIDMLPPGQQQMFYHAEPLDVAADLAGWSPTRLQVERYLELVKRLQWTPVGRGSPTP